MQNSIWYNTIYIFWLKLVDTVILYDVEQA